MQNNALKTLYFYNGIFSVAAAMLGPLYAIYVTQTIDGIMAISISWAVFLISSSIFTYVVSKFGDKIKEKEYLLLGGYAARIISWLSLIFIHNLWELMLVQVFLGVGEALGTPAFNALVAAHLDKNKYIEQYSKWSLVYNLTSAVGIIIGGLIVEGINFQLLFLIMSGLSLISFFGILLKPRKLL